MDKRFLLYRRFNLNLQCGWAALLLATGLICVGGYAEELVFSSPTPTEGASGIIPWTPTTAVETDRTGNWVAVWTASTDGDYDVYFSRSGDDGATWSAPEYLDLNGANDAVDDKNVSLAYGGGVWTAVWDTVDNVGGFPAGWEEKDILFAQSFDGGVTWSEPAAVNAEAATDYYKSKNHVIDDKPCVATDGAGRWVVAWLRREMTPSVYTTWFSVRSLSEGSWSEELTYGREWTSGSMELAYGNSMWILKAACNNFLPEGYLTEMSVYRSPDGMHWIPREIVHTGVIGDAYGISGLWTNGAGAWLVFWQESYGDSGATRILGCRSTDNGETWLAPVPLFNSGNLDGQQTFASMDSDTDGNLVAAVGERLGLGGELGTDSDILAYLSTDAGLTWTGPSLVYLDAYEDASDDVCVQIRSVSNGKWVALWRRNGVGVMRAATEPVPGVSVNPRFGLYTSEDGATTSFTVVLKTAPAANETVTANIYSDNLLEGTVTSGSTFTFTDTNFSDPATHVVTIAGVDDAVRDGNVPYAIAIELSSTYAASPYHQMVVEPVVLLNMDNEPLTASVSGISYLLAGKRNRDLWALVDVVDELGEPVYGAYVSVDILLNGNVVLADTQPTDGAGEAGFKVPNAPNGTYSTVVRHVIKEGYLWDGVTPPNSFTK